MKNEIENVKRKVRIVRLVRCLKCGTVVGTADSVMERMYDEIKEMCKNMNIHSFGGKGNKKKKKVKLIFDKK